MKINNNIDPLKNYDKDIKNDSNSNKEKNSFFENNLSPKNPSLENKLRINNELDKILQPGNKNSEENLYKENNKINNRLVDSSHNDSFKNKQSNQMNSKCNYLDDTETRKKNIEVLKKEYNDLADFLNIKSSDDKISTNLSNEIFKVDLFTNKNKLKNNPKDEEDEIIEIERDNQNLNKVKNMFDDFNIDQENNEEDDLLDLMDLACKK